MALREFYRGYKVGSDYINNTLGDMDENTVSDFFERVHITLQELDDRLFWQPETSEIFYEDVETEKPLPFGFNEFEFLEWWEEKTQQIYEEICNN